MVKWTKKHTGKRRVVYSRKKRAAVAASSGGRRKRSKMQPVIKRRKIATAKKRVESVVRKVMAKQIEKRMVRTVTPYTHTEGFSALQGVCNTTCAIGRSDHTSGDLIAAFDFAASWHCYPLTASEQGDYNGVSRYRMTRSGGSLRIVSFRDGGRLRIEWPTLVANDVARNSSAYHARLIHDQVLIECADVDFAKLLLQDAAAGNQVRRIVYGLLNTTNKPLMTAVEAASSDTLIGNAVFTGENYSYANRQPLHECPNGATYDWTNVRKQFKVLHKKRKVYRRPRQYATYLTDAHNPGGVDSRTTGTAPIPPVAPLEVTGDAFLNHPTRDACTSEHDYSFGKVFKGGKKIMYEDGIGAAETGNTLGKKPLVVLHMFRSEGNADTEAIGAKVDQCFGARQLHFQDL